MSEDFLLKQLFTFSFLLLIPSTMIQAASDPEYSLAVSFDLPASRVIGKATTHVESGPLRVSMGNLKLTEIRFNGRNIGYSTGEEGISIQLPEPGILAVSYEGIFKDGIIAAGSRNVIKESGIALAGAWYPRIEGLVRYRLKATLPAGYEAVSEADRVEKTGKKGETEFIFIFDHPLDHLTLLATDRYEVSTERINGIEILAYFRPENREAAGMYLGQARKYLEIYEKLLTKYPYSRFSIVENFLPSSYSTPTFTVVGRNAVRLPFIETSFAREVLTQWFGNSVYIDSGKGNWAQGLTTYLAEHLFEEQNNRGWEYRKLLLLNYDAYVNPENEVPLREFKGGTDPVSKAIGSGKGALVFHMLRRFMGEEPFFNAMREFASVRKFQRAGWDDIRAACEQHAKKDLTPFFRQWVDQKGLPEANAVNYSVRLTGDNFDIGFEILQGKNVFALDLPSEISFMRGGVKPEMLAIDTEKKSFKLTVAQEPRTLAIDADYDVARRLTDAETPPTIAAMLGEKKPLILLPESGREVYKTVIDAFKAKGAEERAAGGLKDEDVKNSSLVVLGDQNAVISRLFGMMEMTSAGFTMTVRKNPWNSRKVIAVVNARSASEADAAYPHIHDYAEWSSVAFENGKNVSKRKDSSQRGIKVELRQPASAIDPSALKTLSDAIEAAGGKKIVYVGEFHDKYSHHLVQLQVLKSLYEKNPKIAVGMEMFQRPFQPVLDDFVEGKIDEAAFLKKSEYFKRWGFDYNLYKPILDYARSQRIPVVALNLRGEITGKVSKGGIDSLSSDEKKEIPEALDFSDDEYRERLKIIFNRHRNSGEKNFDFFYQAQILWDESMAMSIDEFLKKNPDHVMVVFAGSGHLAYGSGIPRRAFRRNGYPYFIILSDADIDRTIAHFVIQPEPLEGAGSPKLMAALNVEDNRVRVADLPGDSISKAAGIKVGDVILALDGTQVESVEDIKFLLFFKHKGETVKVNVLRKGFFRNRKMDIEVTL